jgi:hypothetical protein
MSSAPPPSIRGARGLAFRGGPAVNQQSYRQAAKSGLRLFSNKKIYRFWGFAEENIAFSRAKRGGKLDFPSDPVRFPLWKSGAGH